MKLLLPIVCLLLLSHFAQAGIKSDSLLAVLKAEISKKKQYDEIKDRGIAMLQQKLAAIPANDFPAQYDLVIKLYDVYKGYIFDSAYSVALKLSELSRQMHDPQKQAASQLKVGEVELESGRIKETFDVLAQMDLNILSKEVRLRYYDLKTRAYSDLDEYNTHEFHTDTNRKESIKALDSALQLSEPGSFERDKHIAELLTISGHPDKAVLKYEEILNGPGITDHQVAMVAYDLSLLVSRPYSLELLTLSAISDIRSAENRTLASFELGKLLFREERLMDAKIVLQNALTQATIYGTTLRRIEIETNLNRINSQMLIDSENNKNRVLTVLLIILGIAIVLTIYIAVNGYLRLQRVKQREWKVQQQNLQLDRINKKLLEDAGIKEEYIGYFFNVISGYIQRLEEIKRSTEHGFKLKNYDEVLKLAHSIDIKRDRHDLFFTFDKLFLKLFPNFIMVFNSMLRQEDQIWPKHNEALNTPLRIFALMRLGIRENQTIANILESSVSTVYTYKNRIKSKALIQPDEFDHRIMEIQYADL